MISQSPTQYVLTCKVFHSKVLSKPLSVINVTRRERDTTCQVVAHETGLFFIVDLEDKSFQATAILKPEIFQEHKFPSEAIRFSLNLANLLDCLNLYGNAAVSTAVHMHYPGPDNTLVLSLNEGDKVTECKLRTGRAEDQLDPCTLR
eukprot:NODE_11113_length_563_cov_1.897727_g10832_i0.p1 GENE.NODE_11113_length_563_cov_1.897727_g10832_i0~~NODE_11113_length_563_cov_1.897727_g10832_i0.p1  ORF type:complete len:147 (+),score=19.53 NODE_11113_length_563_cov_1.897727_g10832_i0:119-559(+)